MARVHRMAAILITGAMCSTASDLLDSHANILPFQQILRNHCHRAALRLATLHVTHLLHKGIAATYRYLAKCNFDRQKRLLSPIHKLIREFKINLDTTKTIQPIHHYPKWSADVDMRIAESKEKAFKEDEGAEEELRAYSDSLVIDGAVGGAAVLMEGERRIGESRFHLGMADMHTVYEGEVVGISSQ